MVWKPKMDRSTRFVGTTLGTDPDEAVVRAKLAMIGRQEPRGKPTMAKARGPNSPLRAPPAK